MSIRSARRALGVAAIALIVTTAFAHAQGYPARFDFGAPASEQDIARLAIAIPADGKGLPLGRGDYAKGKQVYEIACAACHGADLKGVAGLPNMPSGAALRLIGGRGTLTSQKPTVTVESYWPYATTLFDYIRRAMPVTNPLSLSDSEVYALTAYVLHLNGIVDENAVLDARTLPQVKMPNRDGFVDWSRR
jgi:mono/diheme cytochrome c family protein